MTHSDYIKLLGFYHTYRTRLIIASKTDNYFSVLEIILNNIKRTVKFGSLTKEQGDALVRIISKVSVESDAIEGLESIKNASTHAE